MISQEVKDFYSDKRIAVIGGAGMVGSKLVDRLVDDLGRQVVVVDDFSRGKYINGKAIYVLTDGMGCLEKSGYDILESNKAADFGADASEYWAYANFLESVDVVFNLAAAVAGVLHNQNNHVQMYDDNVRLLAGPLRASELAGVKNYLQTSSVCVYAEDYQDPCVEAHGWGGSPHPANAGYAEAKRDGERMVHWSNIERAIIVRPSNIVGERDYFDELAHVIPAFIKRGAHLKDNEYLQAYGSPGVQREFIYSGDVADGMLTAMALGRDRGAYNVGTSAGIGNAQNMITMLSLAHKCANLTRGLLGKPAEVHVVFDNNVGGGDTLRYSDSTRLRNLGWVHEVGLNEAIYRTAKYYVDKVMPQ